VKLRILDTVRGAEPPRWGAKRREPTCAGENKAKIRRGQETGAGSPPVLVLTRAGGFRASAPPSEGVQPLESFGQNCLLSTQAYICSRQPRISNPGCFCGAGIRRNVLYPPNIFHGFGVSVSSGAGVKFVSASSKSSRVKTRAAPASPSDKRMSACKPASLTTAFKLAPE